MANRNKLVVPGVESALNQMKLEIAQEFGFSNYDKIDKGELTARQNGQIGGEITRRLIALGEKYLAEQSSEIGLSKQDLQQKQNNLH